MRRSNPQNRMSCGLSAPRALMAKSSASPRIGPCDAVFGGNGSGTFLGEIRGGTQHGTANKNVPEDAPHAQICRVFPVRPFFHDCRHVDGESFSQSRVVHTPWRIL